MSRFVHGSCKALILSCLLSSAALSQSETTVAESLELATRFMTTAIADHGGYAYVSSPDGRYSHGEGPAGPDRIWVQPPGTPAVGEAFLAAYAATGDAIHLRAAEAAAKALVRGQLASGGWAYSVDFQPDRRREIPYLVDLADEPQRLRQLAGPAGRYEWLKQRNSENRTAIDDNVTSAALQFLIRYDVASDRADPAVKQAIDYALTALIRVQYPNGGWPHNYDRYPTASPPAALYPVIPATYPPEWSRTWTKDFSACYYLNDNVTLNEIATMLMAAAAYDRDDCRAAAVRGGEFLLLAQMPDPQPAWAQQYSEAMHPVWDRKFEPPAISGGESQAVIATLMDLYAATGDRRFAEPIPRALDYLENSELPDGRLARFYELQTNRPIYFDREYHIVYQPDHSPTHYGFIVDSKIDSLRQRLDKLESPAVPATWKRSETLDAKVQQILAHQRPDGAWLSEGFVRDDQGKKTDVTQVVDSQVFIENVTTLATWLQAHAK